MVKSRIPMFNLGSRHTFGVIIITVAIKLIANGLKRAMVLPSHW